MVCRAGAGAWAAEFKLVVVRADGAVGSGSPAPTGKCRFAAGYLPASSLAASGM